MKVKIFGSYDNIDTLEATINTWLDALSVSGGRVLQTLQSESHNTARGEESLTITICYDE